MFNFTSTPDSGLDGLFATQKVFEVTMVHPKFVKPPPSKIKLDAIPTAKTKRSPLLSLPFEIREEILAYSIEWKDLVCMGHRGHSTRPAGPRLKMKLEEMPFWFDKCPTVLALNRQIICETVKVLMRRELVIAPLRQGVKPDNDEWANRTIVWPMARLLKLYDMASWGERLHLTPKLVLKAPDVLAGSLWMPLREVLLMWREGIVYEQLKIGIWHGHGSVAETSSVHEIRKRTSVVVEKEFPRTLFVRSLQWASLAETVDKRCEKNGPRTLESLEHFLQAPIALSKCMPGRVLDFYVLTGVTRC
ncbi:hypothetical protein FKW77_006556 [Venturia effusa]|uniref:F-box domain-containing protein n=1 Tax=Venturia effusa TaxID=50376 RepID=A0A517LHJ9_9PEZI|nr:hypothetical protein FKW77_006556 [Venturia effusa]